MSFLNSLSSTQTFILLIAAMITLYSVFSVVMQTLRHRASERTRREALAYVAEGTMNADVAEQLLKAGRSAEKQGEDASSASKFFSGKEDSDTVIAEAAETRGETKRAVYSLVTKGKISGVQASHLLEAMCSEKDVNPAQDGVSARFCEAHTTYQDLIERLGAGQLSYEDALHLVEAERSAWKSPAREPAVA